MNQFSLAAELAPGEERLARLAKPARGRFPSEEAECSKAFWRIFADHVTETDDFRRGRDEGGVNNLLNYGYAVLLSTILQNLSAVGLLKWHKHSCLCFIFTPSEEQAGMPISRTSVPPAAGRRG
jgi:hypothetical protein